MKISKRALALVLICVLIIGAIVPVVIIMQQDTNRIRSGNYTLHHIVINGHRIDLSTQEGTLALLDEVAIPITRQLLGDEFEIPGIQFEDAMSQIFEFIITSADRWGDMASDAKDYSGTEIINEILVFVINQFMADILAELLDGEESFLGGHLPTGVATLTVELLTALLPLILDDADLFERVQDCTEFVLNPEEQFMRILELFGSDIIRDLIIGVLADIFPYAAGVSFLALANLILDDLYFYDYITNEMRDYTLLDVLVYVGALTQTDADALLLGSSRDLLEKVFHVILPDHTRPEFTFIWTTHAAAITEIIDQFEQLDWLNESLLYLFGDNNALALTVTRDLMEDVVVLDMIMEVFKTAFTIIPGFDLNVISSSAQSAFFDFIRNDLVEILLDFMDDLLTEDTDVIPVVIGGLFTILNAVNTQDVIEFLMEAVREIEDILPIALDILDEARDMMPEIMMIVTMLPNVFEMAMDAAQILELSFGRGMFMDINGIDELLELAGDLDASVQAQVELLQWTLGYVRYFLDPAIGGRQEIHIYEVFDPTRGPVGLLEGAIGSFLAIASVVEMGLPGTHPLNKETIQGFLDFAAFYTRRTHTITFELGLCVGSLLAFLGEALELDMPEIDLGIDIEIHFRRN